MLMVAQKWHLQVFYLVRIVNYINYITPICCMDSQRKSVIRSVTAVQVDCDAKMRCFT